MSITKSLSDSIINQETILKPRDRSLEIQSAKRSELRKNALNKVDEMLSPTLLQYVHQARDKGASSWLNALPLESQGFVLNKEEFRDALCLRYNVPITGLPSKCACKEAFDVTHALSCKKGGFVTKQHDNIKTLFTTLLNKVSSGVESEPHLLVLDNVRLRLKTANATEDARLDIKSNGFWRHGQDAYFDVRVTHVNATTNRNRDTADNFREHELAKKRVYLQRVLEIQHGIFTPLVMGTNGGMGEECKKFITHLANKLASKQHEQYSDVITWIRANLSFEILKSTILCIRGSRTPYKSMREFEDFKLSIMEANIC